MSTLVERKEQAVSATDFSRHARQLLDSLVSGEQSRLVVFRKNRPSAVVLSVDAFETLMDELTDLRMEREAIKRLQEPDQGALVSDADMEDAFRE